MMILKKGLTLSMELNQYFFLHKLELAASKQAFSKKRELLNPEVFIEANDLYIKSFYQKDDLILFNNKYIVAAIDGVNMEIPNTENLKETFGVATGKKDQLEVARTRNSALYDCLNHMMISFHIGHYETSERDLAKDNILKALEVLDNSFPLIVIFDRGYPSIDMLHFLEKNNVKYIIRLQDNTYNAEIKSMNTNDEVINLKITNNRLRGVNDKKVLEELKERKVVTTRIVKHVLKNGTVEVLATNLSNEEISGAQLGEMYFKRWRIETAYDVLKNKLYIENVSGKSELAVIQDFYATILAYNMMEDIKTDANKGVSRNKENGAKYDYKVNTNTLAGAMKLCLMFMIIETKKRKVDKIYDKMLKMIQRELVAIIPDRSFERKKYIGHNKHKTNIRRNC